MSDLNTSQKLFSDVLQLQGNWTDTKEHQARDAFHSLLRENVSLPGMTGIGIYRNNSLGARQQCLQFIYPVTVKILGLSCFSQIATDYVLSTPATKTDLNYYGCSFSDYLSDQILTRSTFQEYPYLSDLARLEWLYHAAYYAPDDEPPADIQQSAVGSGCSIILSCSNALFIMSTTYPVHAIWDNHQGGQHCNDVMGLCEEECLLIVRQNKLPEIEKISKNEFAILNLLIKPCDVEALVEMAHAEVENIEQLLPVMIQQRRVQARLAQQ